MGFYGSEPCTTASAYYVWTAVGEPGHFLIEVRGDAPNYTTGIQLVRDPHWVGGLKVDVMGWTGPLGPGTRPYRVEGTFPGTYLPNVVVACKNHTHIVPVKEVPAAEVEGFLRGRTAA